MKLTNDSNFFENIEKPIAFVFGNDSINVLGAIRSLGKANIPTVVLNPSLNKQLFSFSKYCINIICPDSKNSEKKYIDLLLTLGKKLRTKGVLFPTNDIDLQILLKYREVLEKYFIYPMPELNIVDKLLDKSNFYIVLEQEKIPHPKTFFPNNINDLHEIIKKISFPSIIKPALSGYFRLDFPKKKFFIARTKEELIKYYNILIERNHKFIIQEIIPGEASNQYGFNAYYDQNFNPHGIFMYQRIREWPILAGNGCYLQKVDIPELEKITTSLIKKIKYFGILDAEFRKDPRDGLFKLIEINPRIWLQNSFPAYCCINLPYIAYMNAIGKNVEKVESMKDSVKWLDFYADINSAIINLKRDTLSLQDWIKSYKGKKQYALFTWDDPFPAFVSFVNYILIEFPYLIIRNIR